MRAIRVAIYVLACLFFGLFSAFAMRAVYDGEHFTAAILFVMAGLLGRLVALEIRANEQEAKERKFENE